MYTAEGRAADGCKHERNVVQHAAHRYITIIFKCEDLQSHLFHGGLVQLIQV